MISKNGDSRVVLGFPKFWRSCEYRIAIGNFIPIPLIEQAGCVINPLTKLLSVVPAYLFYKPARIRPEKIMETERVVVVEYRNRALTSRPIHSGLRYL
jgi:hypothetical protein